MIVAGPMMKVVGVARLRPMRTAMTIVVVAFLVAIMCVAVPVIMMMIVVMRFRRARLGLHVCAAFGVERRLERNDPGPQALGHRLDHGIAADAQRLRQEFGRQMAIAEMPGDACQRQRVSGPDLRQRLWRRDHLDNASILESQTVAAAQHRGFREVEQEFEAADAGHDEAPAIALVEIEHHRVGRRAGPLAGGDDFVGAQHHRLSAA